MLGVTTACVCIDERIVVAAAAAAVYFVEYSAVAPRYVAVIADVALAGVDVVTGYVVTLTAVTEICVVAVVGDVEIVGIVTAAEYLVSVTVAAIVCVRRVVRDVAFVTVAEAEEVIVTTAAAVVYAVAIDGYGALEAAESVITAAVAEALLAIEAVREVALVGVRLSG